MEWNDSLSVGVDLIDTEHKQLIQAINDLFDACMQGKGRAKIAETLQFLEDYTKSHFTDEEALQKKYQYPGFPLHQKIHQGFVNDIQFYKKQLEENGPTIALVAKFNSFASAWLIKHISVEDKKIGIHIRSVSAK